MVLLLYFGRFLLQLVLGLGLLCGFDFAFGVATVTHVSPTWYVLMG